MISMDKQYKTRDGREVRLLCTDKAGEYPVVALVRTNGYDTVTWNLPSGARFADGKHNENVLDLIEVPKIVTRKVWLVFYDYAPTKHPVLQPYFTKESAELEYKAARAQPEFYSNVALVEQDVTYEVQP